MLISLIFLCVHKNQSCEEYTKILPLYETEYVNYEMPGQKQDREYPYSAIDERKKLSVISYTKVHIFKLLFF